MSIKPVLIFTGALSPEKAVFKHFIKDFADPSFVIAADSGLVCAEDFGYTPDLIVGDMDSLNDKSRLAPYPACKIRLFERDKAESDTVLALEAAFAKRAEYKNQSGTETLPPVILCGGDGGRIDHLLGIVKQFERSFFPDIWLCREQAVYVLRPYKNGSPFILNIEAARCAEHISVFPVPLKNCDYKISSKGLEWPLDNLDWKNEGFSLSNRVSADYLKRKKNVVLCAERGAFIAIVPYRPAAQG